MPPAEGFLGDLALRAESVPTSLPHPQWPSVPGWVVTARLGFLMSDVDICSQQPLFASNIKGTLRANVYCH